MPCDAVPGDFRERRCALDADHLAAAGAGAFVPVIAHAAPAQLRALAPAQHQRHRRGPLLSAFEVMWPDYWKVVTERVGVRSPVATAGGVKVDNAKVTATDIVASNGVIHVIDSVVLPK